MAPLIPIANRSYIFYSVLMPTESTDAVIDTAIDEQVEGELSLVRDKRTGLTQGRARFAYLYVLGPHGIGNNAKLAYATAFRWIAEPSEFDDLPTKKQAKAHDYGNRLLNKPEVLKVIERYRRELAIETDQSRATWIARAVEMREECMRRGKEQAAAKIHRDIGEALDHFKTRIEISSVPRSGDIITEIGLLLKSNPQLMSYLVSELRDVDLPKMIESQARNVEPDPPTHEEVVQNWNPGVCP